MRVLCVSNDSEMFIIPGANNRGVRPHLSPSYMEALDCLGSKIPGCYGDDIGDPSLDAFRLPLGEMLGGRFTEVRRLHRSIPGSNLSVLSTRHGLTDSLKKVLPYSCVVQNRKQVERLDDRKDFVRSLGDEQEKYDLTLVFLPRSYVEVIRERWHGDMDGMLFVTSPSLFYELKCLGASVLERRGARVGKQNTSFIREELCGRMVRTPGFEPEF